MKSFHSINWSLSLDEPTDYKMCEQKDYIHCFNNGFVDSLKNYRTVRVASIGATTGALGSQGINLSQVLKCSKVNMLRLFCIFWFRFIYHRHT